ncbi:hypothetical protein WMY93_031490 [Mugilogobius chulae]|uniref:Reverse transcriptase domain-containing protein n=1 Tax=Mugilogobius chulae TaxID=88201 RepID=A0AAW0ME24_9GOBI
MCVGPRAPLVYTKEQLLALRSAAVLPRDRHEIPADLLKKTRRGCRAGRKLREKKRRFRPVLPSVIMGNVRSLSNKTDELAALTRYQREYRDTSLMLFTETWLTTHIPDSAIAMDNFHLLRADRTAESGKKKGGGLAVFVNEKWCKPGHCVVKEQRCNKDIELLAVSVRPYYLPREFTHVIVIAVYVPPSANAETACETLLSCTSTLQTQHPQALFLISGDFNHSSPASVLPTFTQYVTCPTRDNKTLDLFFVNAKEAYSSSPLPPLGRADHNIVHLRPVYQPIVHRQPVVSREEEGFQVREQGRAEDCTEEAEEEDQAGQGCVSEENGTAAAEPEHQGGVSRSHTSLALSQRCVAEWILDYLTNRPQFVRARDCVSDLLTCSVGAPQGTVLAPFLFTLYTADFRHNTESCVLQKFSDDSAIIGLITDDDDAEYRGLTQDFVDWCQQNHLLLNAGKTKEMVVDFRRRHSIAPPPVNIQGRDIERVDSYKPEQALPSEKTQVFWSEGPLLRTFYDSVVASAILYGVVCWSSSITERERKKLDKVIKKSSSVLGCPLDSVREVGDRRVLARFTSMLDHESHPLQDALSALESSFSDRLIHPRCVKERFRRSFLPAAVRLYNEHC